MCTHNICFRGGIRKIFLQDQHFIWSSGLLGWQFPFVCSNSKDYLFSVTLIEVGIKVLLVSMINVDEKLLLGGFEIQDRLFLEKKTCIVPVKKKANIQTVCVLASFAAGIHACITFYLPKSIDIFLFLHKNICCGYSLEVPQRYTSRKMSTLKCYQWKHL